MSSVTVSPSPLNGKVTLPPSKSHTMRALVLSAMAKGHSRIYNPLFSPDVDAMIQAIRGLGAECLFERDHICVKGISGKVRPWVSSLDVGNSGIVLRFASALYALADSPILLSGDNSICHRRLFNPLANGLKKLGAEITFLEKEGFAPVCIHGPLFAGRCSVDGQDSQTVSALLLSLPFLDGDSIVTVENMGETPWVEMTLAWLDRVGILVKREENSFFIPGGQKLPGFSYSVPSDMSGLAFMVAAALVTESDVCICGIDRNQGDYKIIEHVQKMGAVVSLRGNLLYIKGPQKLRGIDLDINETVDALPVLSILAACAEGSSRFYNGAICRNKESDRIAAMACALSSIGINVEEMRDGLTIYGGDLQGSTLDGKEDHRVVMALTVAGLRKEMTICGIECTNKSFPGFFSTLQALGAHIEIVK